MATPVEQLEQMKKTVESLGTRRQGIQVKLEAARQQLTEARKEAKTLYDTEDLGELKAILARQEEANARALEDYANAVREFEGFIARIEEAMSNPQVMAEMLTQLPELPLESTGGSSVMAAVSLLGNAANAILDI